MDLKGQNVANYRKQSGPKFTEPVALDVLL